MFYFAERYDVVNCRDPAVENEDQTEAGMYKLNGITKKCCGDANFECRIMTSFDESHKEVEEFVCVNSKQTEISMAKMVKSLDTCCEHYKSASQGNAGTEENFPKKCN